MISALLYGIELHLDTVPTLFSPNDIDLGTCAMLSLLELRPEDKVLDLGCGCGVVGIWAALHDKQIRVTSCDIDPVAVETTRRNAKTNHVDITVIQSDGLSAVPDTGYTLILSNPPYHTDFSVAKSFIEKGFNRLVIGGRMYMVTKRLEWYRLKLTAVFGGCKVHEINGYYVFEAEKRTAQWASRRKK